MYNTLPLLVFFNHHWWLTSLANLVIGFAPSTGVFVSIASNWKELVISFWINGRQCNNKTRQPFYCNNKTRQLFRDILTENWLKTCCKTQLRNVNKIMVSVIEQIRSSNVAACFYYHQILFHWTWHGCNFQLRCPNCPNVSWTIPLHFKIIFMAS